MTTFLLIKKPKNFIVLEGLNQLFLMDSVLPSLETILVHVLDFLIETDHP